MARLKLPPNEYEIVDVDGTRMIVCTLRQKALHTIGLNSGRTKRRLYTRHGKKFYKPFRNYFYGKDDDLDKLVDAGYMKASLPHTDSELKYYFFTRKGLDWLGEQLEMVSCPSCRRT